MRANNRKLILNLSCGHALVLDRQQAAATMSGGLGVGGTTASCPKCPGYAIRRIVERSWVDDNKKESSQ